MAVIAGGEMQVCIRRGGAFGAGAGTSLAIYLDGPADKKDIAGLNIKDSLLNLYDFKETGEKYGNNSIFQLNKNIKLYTTEKDSIYCENIDKEIEADLFIFATKHKATSKIPSLSVHTQGNWSKAEFGGRNRQVCIAPACYLKQGLIKLNELGKQTDFEIIQECTHHGPYLEKPSMFIEIGSSEEQWKRKDAADIIAKTIYHLVTNEPKQCKTAFGIGGLHHTPNFKKIILNSDIALGHVCPKYMLQSLDKVMIKQALEKTMEKVEVIVLDWKGLKTEKQRISSLLKEMGLDYVKDSELR